jgi:hypothetical protein
MRGSIGLHIEELVLDGFGPGDQRQIAVALQLELTQLLQREGLGSFTGNANLQKLKAGTIRLPHQPRAANVGRAVAGVIHRGLRADRFPRP